MSVIINKRKELHNQTYAEYVVQLITNVAPDYIQRNKVLVSDCDGILTNGFLGYTTKGKTQKFFGGHDKEAIKILLLCGWTIHFVTDDRIGLSITRARINEILGLGTVYDKHGVVLDERVRFTVASPSDRANIVETYKKDKNVDFVGFIGDSLSDIEAMSIADFSGTTASSLDIVKDYCHIESDRMGGDGGFADVVLHMNEILACNVYNDSRIDLRKVFSTDNVYNTVNDMTFDDISIN